MLEFAGSGEVGTIKKHTELRFNAKLSPQIISAMKGSFFILLSGCIVCLGSGCTTTTYNQNQVIPAPEGRIYAFTKPIENAAVVKITRLNNWSNGICYQALVIDDQKAVSLALDEQAKLYVPAGEHKFQVTYDWDEKGWCGIGASKEGALSMGQIRKVNLKPNYEYDFRMGFNSWGKVFRLYVDEFGKPVEH